MSGPLKLLLLAIATLIVSAFAISNQSFWIDEGAAGMKAIQPSVVDWWHALRVEGHSNLQLLPHLFYLWGWEKLFGASEVSLRTANVPLLFAGLAAALWALQGRPRMQFWFTALALTNAFTWYYLSEARPYILLFAASCVALAGLIRLVEEVNAGNRTLAPLAVSFLGLFLVAATSLVAVPWTVGWLAGVAVLLGRENFFRLLRDNLPIVLGFLAAMTALAVYYGWTIQLGARASAIATTNIANLFFVLYEQLGLAGFGPGRTQMRVNVAGALAKHALPLALGVFALIIIAWQAWRSLPATWWRSRQALAVLLGVLLPLGLVMLAGNISHVRILGRHLMPLFPFVLFALALGMRQLGTKNGRWARVALSPSFRQFSSLPPSKCALPQDTRGTIIVVRLK